MSRPARIVAAALTLSLGVTTGTTSGCVLVAPLYRVDSGIPATIPELDYEVKRTVAASVSREEARAMLERIFGRTRMPNGQLMRPSVGEERFAYRYRLEFPLFTAFDHEIELAFAETSACMIDLRALGGEVGVKFRRHGEDVPYAWLATSSREDAETIIDALVILGRPSPPP